jgi:hypothetical protein
LSGLVLRAAAGREAGRVSGMGADCQGMRRQARVLVWRPVQSAGWRAVRST